MSTLPVCSQASFILMLRMNAYDSVRRAQATLQRDQNALAGLKLRLAALKQTIHAQERARVPAPPAVPFPPSMGNTVALAHSVLDDLIAAVIERSHFRLGASEVAKYAGRTV